MKIQNLKKVLKEDLKDSPAWVNGLIIPINALIDTTSRALINNLSFSDNFAAEVKQFSLKTSDTYANNATFSFVTTLKTKATGVMVMQAYETSSYVASNVSLAWIEDNGNIKLSKITGLEPSKEYTIRVLVV